MSNELSNNTTIAVEICVGGIIALIVYMNSRRNEVIIQKKIDRIDDTVEKQNKIMTKEKDSSLYFVRNMLDDIKNNVVEIIDNINIHNRVVDIYIREKYVLEITTNFENLKNISKENLYQHIMILSKYCGSIIINKLKSISDNYQSDLIMSDDNKNIDISPYHNIFHSIQSLEKEFETGKIVYDPTELQLESFGPLSISTDRSIYPLESTIHISTNLDHVIPRESLKFEIFNSNRELLVSKTLDPATLSFDTDAHTISFKMEGDAWKIKNTYIARVTYGERYNENSFFVDQSTPVLESDRLIYPVGSEIILTVTDIDANKDSQIIEHVGDSDDSKLIIESPHNKIDGCKLTEIKPSTGIFEGIIKILETDKNEKIISQNVNEMNKSSENNYITGFAGDEIIIKYTNKTNVVSIKIRLI